MPPVGLDVGFAVLPALRAAIRQGRVAWGHLMVSSAAMQSGLPSNWAHAFYLIHAATLPKITLKTAHLKNTLSERGGAAWSPRRPRHGLLGKFRIISEHPLASRPLTSPPGAPQRQLSVTGTDRTLDCPCVTWIWSFRCF